ncbi:MAG: haloacid dehalogenase-like hydrolase, partial [Schwartzia sp.]|nr:haloacid dehalogenase-like hydrolase [Schwartzia sp. (in: firmicutes)]
NDHFYDRRKEKIVISGAPLIDNAKTRKIFSILNQIGKKPVLAFGNSMGDSGMFEYTLQDNPYPSAAFCVLCDDLERELGNTAKADAMKKTADERGWNTISMKGDFKTIYGENVKRADR